MNIKLTKAQAEIAEWAVGAAPESDTDGLMRDNPDLIVGEHPMMVNPNVVSIGSTAWAEDFISRIETLYPDVVSGYGWQEFMEKTNDPRKADLMVHSSIRSSMALGKKVRAAFPDAEAS